jgi:beta-phosphoglucomutase-like phosphatase (HAD superfamily)
MIKAVIFDMDGLLIDSEPLWRESARATRAKFGIHLPPDMAGQTMGLRSDEAVRFWHNHSPWDKPSQKVVDEYWTDRIVELIESHDIERPGVQAAIKLIEAAGLPMAIASSSRLKVIHAGIKKLGISHKMKVIHSAEHEAYGKPHPAVYITTAQRLGVHPELCLVFEDSPNGVLAAKAAKMRCVAIPDEGQKDNKIFGIADIMLTSLLELKASDLKY